MPILSIGTTAEKLIEANKKRTTLTIANDHTTAKLYVSDKPDPDASAKAKWIVWPQMAVTFHKLLGDFPERAYYGISDTASTTVIVGGSYKERD